VGRRILAGAREIVGLGDDTTVRPDDDRADRHLAEIGGGTCQGERAIHMA